MVEVVTIKTCRGLERYVFVENALMSLGEYLWQRSQEGHVCMEWLRDSIAGCVVE